MIAAYALFWPPYLTAAPVTPAGLRARPCARPRPRTRARAYSLVIVISF
jgi:hypothetical protein